MLKKNNFIKLVFGFTPFVLATVVFGCTSSGQSSEFKNSNSVATISPTVKTQTETQISDTDKTQIIVEILKQENLRDAKTRKKETQNLIYILEGNLPVKQIPEIKGIEVKLISEADVKEKNSLKSCIMSLENFRSKI